MTSTAKLALTFACAFALAGAALPVWAQGAAAAKGVLKDSAARLLKDTGVYHAAKGAKMPGFVADASWPQPLPHHWMLGQVGGLYVDRHDHVWVYNRPRTMTSDEAAGEGAVPGGTVSGQGFARPHGPIADCCVAAPSVLEFDTAGKLLQAWGGPADPGWLDAHCQAASGCIWPNSEHGIYVDDKDNVWIAGNSGRVPAKLTPWTTNREGGDGFILKFDMNGNFKMRIGGTPTAPNSNDTNSGINGTPDLYEPADMTVDPKTNRLYVADGYGNRRVLIVDADTGKYIGHFGAYGNNPVDDAAARAAGNWLADAAKGNIHPAFFRNPVHCVKIADDGKIYVCDRGNDRIQIFDSNSPELGKPCSNPSGQAGKCGYLAEQLISGGTETQSAMPGTAMSMNFSKDKAQSCLYVGDDSNMTIYILNRANLSELGRLGRPGRQVGEFHWLHQIGLDSKGNIYTSEVDTGKRVQKFLHYGPAGCSGSGAAVIEGVP